MTLATINDLTRFAAAQRDAIAAALLRVVERGRFVLGPEVDAFEHELADYLGVAHVIGVASGTDALILALRVARAEGRRVVLAANAGAYGLLATLSVGAEPIFVDVAAEDALMDLAAARREIERGEVAAVVVTHLYGRMQALEELVAAARPRGVAVIEDCAQACGATRDGRRAGAVGDLGCFSFYPTKNLGALGDGGAVAMDDPEAARLVRQLREYGWDERHRVARQGGMNSRLDELQAAVLRTRLPRLDEHNRMRREIATRYRLTIRHPGVAVPAFREGDVGHLVVVRVGDREGFTAHLRRHGVPFAVHYPVPDHRQPAFAGRFAAVDLPATEAWAREVVTLPCFPGMTSAEVDEVVGVVNAW